MLFAAVRNTPGLYESFGFTQDRPALVAFFLFQFLVGPLDEVRSASVVLCKCLMLLLCADTCVQPVPAVLYASCWGVTHCALLQAATHAVVAMLQPLLLPNCYAGVLHQSIKMSMLHL
jgi:hypothetical protein